MAAPLASPSAAGELQDAGAKGARALVEPVLDFFQRRRSGASPREAGETSSVESIRPYSPDQRAPDPSIQPNREAIRAVPDREVRVENTSRHCLNESLLLAMVVLDKCAEETSDQQAAADLAHHCEFLNSIGPSMCRELVELRPGAGEMWQQMAGFGDEDCRGPLRATRDALNRHLDYPSLCQGVTEREYEKFERQINAAQGEDASKR